ncbi:hypothetical protein L6R50_27850 [Myxococcota bacterium]|nr:hypothetical protein [Myxococcota bacterium]
MGLTACARRGDPRVPVCDCESVGTCTCGLGGEACGACSVGIARQFTVLRGGAIRASVIPPPALAPPLWEPSLERPLPGVTQLRLSARVESIGLPGERALLGDGGLASIFGLRGGASGPRGCDARSGGVRAPGEGLVGVMPWPSRVPLTEEAGWVDPTSHGPAGPGGLREVLWRALTRGGGGTDISPSPRLRVFREAVARLGEKTLGTRVELKELPMPGRGGRVPSTAQAAPDAVRPRKDSTCCPSAASPAASTSETGEEATFSAEGLGRSGVTYWKLAVMPVGPSADGEGGGGLVAWARDKASHGTVEQLLKDAVRLGISDLRQLEAADAYLGTLWRGDWAVHADPASVPLDGPRYWWAGNQGWNCVPVPTAAEPADPWLRGTACGAVPGTPGSGTCDPDPGGGSAPAFFTGALRDLADEATTRGLTLMPGLFARSDRSRGTDSQFEWTLGRNGEQETGSFWLGGVEDSAWGTSPSAPPKGNEDVLVEQYVRSLLGDLASSWGEGNALPYLMLGNELTDGAISRADLAWLILRVAELVSHCAGAVGADAPKLVFPGLESINGAPLGAGATEPPLVSHLVDQGLELHCARMAYTLWTTFAHVMQCAAIAQFASGDPTRFADVLGPGVTGLGLALADALGVTDLASLIAALEPPEETEEADEADEPPAEPDGEVDPADETDDDAVVYVLTPYEEWIGHWMLLLGFLRLGGTPLRAPFGVMDFHWYNSGGRPGEFQYLSKLKNYVEVMRYSLAMWWEDGEELPIWCTETGISSDQNPQHYADPEVRLDLTVASGTCYGHLGNDPAESPGDNVLDPVTGDCTTATAEHFEYRVDPYDVAARWGGLEGVRPDHSFTCGAPWNFPDRDGWYDWESRPNPNTLGPPCEWAGWGWPPWAFTSPEEQAVQVWTRLCYMAGLGVVKAMWYTNEADAYQANEIVNSIGGSPTTFYSTGLTQDTRVQSLWYPDLALCYMSPFATSDREYFDPNDTKSSLPLLADDYRSRSKKPAFCALRRWNRFLQGYQEAILLPRLDGVDEEGGGEHAGFYAVLFHRAPDSVDFDRYPYALVVWADPQAYGSDFSTPTATRTLGISTASLPVIDGEEVRPVRVATVPRRVSAATGDRPVSGWESPCLDADAATGTYSTPDADTWTEGDAGTGYLGEDAWQFDASAFIPDTGVDAWGFPVATVEFGVATDPVLILLPEGAGGIGVY